MIVGIYRHQGGTRGANARRSFYVLYGSCVSKDAWRAPLKQPGSRRWNGNHHHCARVDECTLPAYKSKSIVILQ